MTQALNPEASVLRPSSGAPQTGGHFILMFTTFNLAKTFTLVPYSVISLHECAE